MDGTGKITLTGSLGDVMQESAKAAITCIRSHADALGIERARLGNYEIGKSWPTAALLPAMADLLNCSIDDLYEPLPEDNDTSEEVTLPCRTSAETSTTTQGELPV